MLDAAAIGELLIDFTSIRTDEYGYPTMAAHPGGAPANFLAAMEQLECNTAFIGKVGKDAFGKRLCGTLEKIGVRTDGIIQSEDYFTTLAFVTLDEKGDREFSFSRKPGADTMLSFEEVDTSIIDDSKLLHFGTLSLTADPSRETTYRLVRYARDKGKIISFDPNLRRSLWDSLDEAKVQIEYGLNNSDIVKISDEEVEFLWSISPEDGAAKIINDYPASIVFVTCGADGAIYSTKDFQGHVAGLKGINVVDTTGAGDIFGGTAVAQILKADKALNDFKDMELHEITRYACAAAGLSTTKSGGISSVPTKKQVIEIMHRVI